MNAFRWACTLLVCHDPYFLHLTVLCSIYFTLPGPAGIAFCDLGVSLLLDKPKNMHLFSGDLHCFPIIADSLSLSVFWVRHIRTLNVCVELNYDCVGASQCEQPPGQCCLGSTAMLKGHVWQEVTLTEINHCALSLHIIKLLNWEREDMLL